MTIKHTSDIEAIIQVPRLAEKSAIAAHHAVNHFYDRYLPYDFHLRMAVGVGHRYANVISIEDQPFVEAALWHHDTLEDTHLGYRDMVTQMTPTNVWYSPTVGDKITHAAEIVFAVTNNKGRNRAEKANAEYYNGIRQIRYGTFVKLCDRLANVIYGTQIEMSSTMPEKYAKENEHFLDSLNQSELKEYDEMVVELVQRLALATAVTKK